MINYYTEYWESPDLDRNIEVINCINKNINSGFFDNFYIFSEKNEPRINCSLILGERKTYQEIFDKSIDGINVLACSDIEFDHSIKLAENINLFDFYALTKYENDGFLHKHYTKNSYSDSQDVWIWKNKSLIKNANFYIGTIAADNALAYIAEMSGYMVTNPCISIKVHHKHDIASRLGSSADESTRLKLPYKILQITEL
jgi:hypothetical protein